MHYNWHRYYDPAVGRYITRDPIGLGGVNTYGYVDGSPFAYFLLRISMSKGKARLLVRQALLVVTLLLRELQNPAQRVKSKLQSRGLKT
ncbi:RHS repeat-associated core domain-containing protein [Chitiniphilus shinanonensis]|uniref:RHS repeat-associated core domain-containing protein n=1 Tax=Chitiniphilus shinanonensis TaxID=553088 RepID=UPI0033426106